MTVRKRGGAVSKMHKDSGGEWCISFHTDYSLRTMQVPLNDPNEYDGRALIWVVDGALEMPASSRLGKGSLQSTHRW